MPDQDRLSYAPTGPGIVQACWLCGIRLPADHMVADGGSACADVRWYCRDIRACAGRWAVAASPGPEDHGRSVGGNSAGTP